jgi:simple sugar transport system substrate-binding protein
MRVDRDGNGGLRAATGDRWLWGARRDRGADSQGTTGLWGAGGDRVVTWTRPFAYLIAGVPLVAVLLAGPSMTGCGSPGQDAGRHGVRIVAVTHGQTADPFWSVVSNGFRAAGRDLGVRVEYQAPSTFDMVEMSDLIQAAVASRPSGLVVSIPDPDALEGAIRSAVGAGIPVISINSGGDVSQALGILAHVGQTEYEAGYGAGERMARAGVAQALCVNHEVGNLALDLRCSGFRDALADAGSSMRVLAVDLADPEGTRQRVAGALRADPGIDGLLTLATIAAEPALQALDETGRLGNVTAATFDLSPEVLAALGGGRMSFAIDQQQYLQGYLPVVLLIQFLETGTMPGGGEVIHTGPGFVTPENAAAVVEWARRGVR